MLKGDPLDIIYGLSPHMVAEDGSIRIPDDVITKPVLFLGYRPSKGGKALYRGTAFLVTVPFKNLGRENGCPFLLTCKHNIDKARKESHDASVVVRWNDSSGKAREQDFPCDEWITLESASAVDAAILPADRRWGIDPYPIRLDNDTFATLEAIEKNNIGVGHEVYMPGLFTEFKGEDRNVPVVRQGNIALMPPQLIPSEGDQMVHGFIVEMHSIGGHSGSPVFVNLSGPGFSDGRMRIASGEMRYCLLGILHGHWDINLENSEVNSGMSIVVPAEKILELFNSSKAQAIKDDLENQILALDAATPDASNRQG